MKVAETGCRGRACVAVSSGGNNDRNFITIVSNTIVNNAGAGVAAQDATAHLYFNVIWNNGASDDIQLMNGSAGADNIVGRPHNIISSINAGLSNTINASTLPNVVNAQFRLSSDVVHGLPATVASSLFTPAFMFTGSLSRNQMYTVDFLNQGRVRADGRFLYGAFAAPAPGHVSPEPPAAAVPGLFQGAS